MMTVVPILLIGRQPPTSVPPRQLIMTIYGLYARAE